MNWPAAFCWSKIGPEAGFTLDQIIRWKELQRSLSAGRFFWGVGGIPGREKQDAFIRTVDGPKVLFCEQLGEAKAGYKNPSATFLWTHYMDRTGHEIELPRFAAVTSKAGASRHYALVCKLEYPISVRTNISFDIGLFGNFQGSPNIANQQPAPIIEENKSGHPKRLYSRGFWADLVDPYFVTLCRGRELSQIEFLAISEMMKSDRTDIDRFKRLIEELK